MMRTASVTLIVLALVAGCSSSGRRADQSLTEFKWLQGELKTALPHPLPEVEPATRAAFDELISLQILRHIQRQLEVVEK